MSNPRVTICVVVMNGEKYLQKCLRTLKKQTYKNFDVIVWNNASEDNTVIIAEGELMNSGVKHTIISNTKNYGLGGGFNRAAKKAKGEYVVLLCVDVLLDKDFLKNSVRRMQMDETVGVVQAKIYRWDFQRSKKTRYIDTVGFTVYPSRRIINEGHGKKDSNKYSKPTEIFSYEGACPVFRKAALEHVQLPKSDRRGYEYLDEDFFWYADDIDLGWRLRLFGWRSVFDPTVIAWHDRSTTKSLAGNRKEFIAMRKELSVLKRRLDWQNQINTFIKNEHLGHLLSNPFPFISRQLQLLTYFLIYERSTLKAIPEILAMLPIMLEKRAIIKKHRAITAKDLKEWF